MSAGLPKYNVVNLSDLDKAFEAGTTVTLDALTDKHLLNISGREARLPLKVCWRAAACACAFDRLHGVLQRAGCSAHAPVLLAPLPTLSL